MDVVNDISRRILRRPLSRYLDAATTPRRRRLRWLIPVLIAWLVWAGFMSEHSFRRLAQLGAERDAMRAELDRQQQSIETLDRDLADPKARRQLAERVARERNGMARPGESVYRFDRKGRVSAPETARPADETPAGR